MYKKISNIPNFKDYFEWDKDNWSNSIKYFEKNSSKKLTHCKVLEIGSRSGLLGAAFLLCGSDVIISDIIRSLDNDIEYKINNNSKLNFEIIDATNIRYTNEFDIIILKSVLGGLSTKQNQLKCIQQVHKALKNNGEFWVMENLKSSLIHKILRYFFVPWSNTWRYICPNEIEEMFSIFETTNYSSNGFLSVFGRNEKQRNFLSKLDNKIIKIFRSNKWHTNFFLVGKK